MQEPVSLRKAALVKDFVCEEMINTSRMCMNVHGSYGLMKDYKVERIYRDSIMGSQVEGVSDMQKMIIAGVILGMK